MSTMPDVDATTMSLRLVVGVVIVGVLAAGCAASDQAADPPAQPEATTAAETTAAEATTPATSDEPPTGDSLPDHVMRSITVDAAEAASVPVPDVEVVRVEREVYPDGSLGCPEPGKLYTQAVVEGWRVLVAAEGRRYDYRVDRRGHFRLCERPGAGTDGTAEGAARPRPLPSTPTDAPG